MSIHNGELLFIKSVKDGIPNRDPLNDSDARRIFSEEDGRISLSDVSIKRDVRDFVISLYPDGGKEQKNHVFVQAIENDKGKLLGRKSLALKIAANVGKEKEAKTNMKDVLIEHAFDVRTFGIVYSEKPKFNLTGPVQFAWAHSMHPVETQYVQGTVTMPSSDVSDQGEGKSQGTIWTSYTLPFAVFSMTGVMNATSAEHSKMTEEDQELLIRALWQGTQNRHARGRGQQEPLFLVHIEYHDPFFRIGFLEDMVTLYPEAESWRQEEPPSQLSEISLDVTKLTATLEQYQDKIKRCRIWKHPLLNVQGDINDYIQTISW